MQSGVVLAREALAQDGKLESTLQACAAAAARRGTPFFILPEGRSPPVYWAARYTTWLLIKLTPKGVVFSFLFSPPVF